MRRLFLLPVLLALLPACAAAQYWRVQASGGLMTATNMTHQKTRFANDDYGPATAAFGTIAPVGGL